MAKIIIGCKLPHGIQLEHGEKKISLDGANKDERISGSLTVIIADEMYGTTEVDEDLWKAWAAANKDFAPYKSGAIFVAKDKASIRAASKDTGKTGFEAMSKEKAGVVPVSAD